MSITHILSSQVTWCIKLISWKRNISLSDDTLWRHHCSVLRCQKKKIQTHICQIAAPEKHKTGPNYTQIFIIYLKVNPYWTYLSYVLKRMMFMRLNANKQQKTHQQFNFFTLSRSDAFARARTSLRVSFMSLKWRFSSWNSSPLILEAPPNMTSLLDVWQCACAGLRVHDNSARPSARLSAWAAEGDT